MKSATAGARVQHQLGHATPLCRRSGLNVHQAIKVGPCTCDCVGCTDQYGHCFRVARGCQWKKE